MSNNDPIDEGADFSSYLKEEQEVIVPTEEISPIQESPKVIRFTKRAKYLLVILGVLAIAQIILVLVVNKKESAQIPDGYRLVTPVNQPAYLEIDK